MVDNNHARERRRQVDRWLERALEQPAGARAMYLGSHCADVEVREEVERLLEHASRMGDFLEDSREAAPDAFWRELGELDDPVDDDRIGSRVGAYRIIEPIQRGGMGTVFLAERTDDELRQRVALKVLRRGLDTDDIVRRFLAERQILASLEHANIARLIDGGRTDDALPYLVMELVRGQPIDEFCTTRKLGLTRRLELFLQVCAAVGAAHRRLVVHRDLKPSNVLVTERADVKLIDFGIAKLLQGSDVETGTPHTMPGHRYLTPEYASPEQVRGEPVTTGSDIYQLGLILHGLLTETRPGRIRSRATTSPGSPARARPLPSSRCTSPRLRRPVRGDLDNIVRMATRQEPERRYASAEQLAEDVRNYLRGRPVSARPDTLRYRALKFLRREPVLSGTIAAAALLLVAYAATVTVYSGRLTAESEAALRQARTAERVKDFMLGIFELSDPTVADGADVTARELLDRAAERLEGELETEPEIRAELLTAMAGVYYRLNFPVSARELSERALAIREQVLDADDPVTVANRLQLAKILVLVGDPGADAALRDALISAEAAVGPADPLVAEILTAWAIEGGDADFPAVGLHDRALEILRATETVDHTQLANALVASSYGRPFEVAYPRLEEALELRQAIHGSEHPVVANTLSDMALVLDETGSPVAVDVMERALDMQRRTAAANDPVTLTIINNLAGLLRDRGEHATAAELYREVLELRLERTPEAVGAIAYSQYGLGVCLVELGRGAEAEEYLRDAVAAFAPSDARRHIAATALGRALLLARRPGEAAAVLLPAQSFLEEAGVLNVAAEAAEALARAYEATGDTEAAARQRETVVRLHVARTSGD